jgi:hypothetical protein
MIGVQNRLPGMRVCEVGTCLMAAGFTEQIRVIPGDPALGDQRHDNDIVLCQRHDEEFQTSGLVGIVTAYGDTITKRSL